MNMNHSLAPEDVTRGALRVLFVAAYTTRNWTLDETISRKQINDLWEALHNVPDLLMRWDDTPRMVKELEGYFFEYTDKWKSPNLVNIYEQHKIKLQDT